jgi:hypothetical protein
MRKLSEIIGSTSHGSNGGVISDGGGSSSTGGTKMSCS